MQIGRFEDGKLAERWGSSDQLGHHNPSSDSSKREASIGLTRRVARTRTA